LIFLRQVDGAQSPLVVVLVNVVRVVVVVGWLLHFFSHHYVLLHLNLDGSRRLRLDLFYGFGRRNLWDLLGQLLVLAPKFWADNLHHLNID